LPAIDKWYICRKKVLFSLELQWGFNWKRMAKISKKIMMWRYKHFDDSQFIILLSAAVGVVAGILAVIMKNTVHWVSHAVHGIESVHEVLYYFTPVVGISLTAIIAKYVLNVNTGHGIPKVLFAISRKNAALSKKNIITSSLFSVLTVGFGGSAGLEGPSASAGAAIGSKIGRILHMEYKQLIVLIGCGSSAAIGAIFNTPIAAILFSLEVLMLDLSVLSIVPLLISSVSGVVVAYFFLGQETIYEFSGDPIFHFSQVPIYVVLGVLASLNAVFFSKMYLFLEHLFEKFPTAPLRIGVGGALLFCLYYLFPSLYGEGYHVINQCIGNDLSFVSSGGLFTGISNHYTILLLLFCIIIFKTVATNVTFGMGGVGGIFAPSLFIGAVTGLFSTYVLKLLGFSDLPVATIVLVAMAGFMTSILHAPLTSIFLIAEVTKSYELIVPLIITSVISYLISKKLMSHSVYTIELARRNELLTHNKNKSVLAKINLKRMLETDFEKIMPDFDIQQLIVAVKRSRRNVFPVVNAHDAMVGVLTLEDIKEYIFDPNEYPDLKIRDIMYPPATFVSVEDTIDRIAKKIQTTGRYNIPVLDNGKYLGFVSRAKLFSEYQREIEKISMGE